MVENEEVNINQDSKVQLDLQTLIAMVDTEELFFSKFEIDEIDEFHLKTELIGEKISPSKGETVVKAVTYYKFKLEQTKEGFKATVSLDI